MLSNAYFLAKFRFDTAEKEPAKSLQNFAKKMQNFPIEPADPLGDDPRPPARQSWTAGQCCQLGGYEAGLQIGTATICEKIAEIRDENLLKF